MNLEMYHKLNDVLMTLPMYRNYTINRLWSPSHMHGFSSFHPITRDTRLLRNLRTCAYKTWKIITEHLNYGYKL